MSYLFNNYLTFKTKFLASLSEANIHPFMAVPTISCFSLPQNRGERLFRFIILTRKELLVIAIVAEPLLLYIEYIRTTYV